MATQPSTVMESETRITVHWSWTKKPVVRLTHLPTGTLVVMRGDTPDSEAECRLDGLAELERSLHARDQLLQRGLVDHYGLHPRETMPSGHPTSSRCDNRGSHTGFSCWWCGIYDPAFAAALDVPANQTGVSLFHILMREDIRSRQELLQRFPNPAALLETRMFGSAKLTYLRQAFDLPANPRTTATAGHTYAPDSPAQSTPPRADAARDATTDLELRQLRYLSRHLSPRVRHAAGLPLVPDDTGDLGLDPRWRQRVDQAARRLDSRTLKDLGADTRIDSLDLTIRTLTILQKAGIHTVGELADTNLTALPTRNPRSLKEISEIIEIFTARSNAQT